MKFKEGDEITGAGILESITSGLYTDNANCIREYIQNSIDSLSNINDENRLKIEISFVNNGDTIIIRDHGEGMNFDELYEAVKIGYSSKSREKNIGWRGIGIYSGVPNFSKIAITTKKDNGKKYSTTIDTRKFLESAIKGIESAREVIEESVDDISEMEDPDFPPGTQITLQNVISDQRPYFKEDVVKYKLIRTVPMKLGNSIFRDRIINFLRNNGIEEPKFSIIFKGSDEKEEELFRSIVNDSIFDPDSFCSYVHKDKNNKPIFAIWMVTAKDNKEIEKGSLRNPLPNHMRIHHGIIFKKKLMTIGNSESPETTVRDRFTGATFHYWNYGEIHVLSNDIWENTNRENFENVTPDSQSLFSGIDEILSEIENVNRKKSSNDKKNKIESIKKLINSGKAEKAIREIEKIKRSIENAANGSNHPLLAEYSGILEQRRISQLQELQTLVDQISRSSHPDPRKIVTEMRKLYKDKYILKLINKMRHPEKKISPNVMNGIATILSGRTNTRADDFVELVKSVYVINSDLGLDAQRIRDQAKLFLISPNKLIQDKPDDLSNCQFAYKINGNIAHLLIGFYQILRNGDEHHNDTFNREFYSRLKENNEWELYVMSLMGSLYALELLVKYSRARDELDESSDLPPVDVCKKRRNKR